MRERCPKARRSSTPNQRWLLRSSGFLRAAIMSSREARRSRRADVTSSGVAEYARSSQLPPPTGGRHGEHRMHRLFAAAAAAFLASLASATAQDKWPERQVNVIVPFTAGGTTDMFGRIFAQHMQA